MGDKDRDIVNTMAANGLVIQGTKWSATMLLKKFSRNIMALVPEKLVTWHTLGKNIHRIYSMVENIAHNEPLLES